MTALASQFKSAFEAADADATAKWQKFAELRDAMTAAGVDATKDADAFGTAHEAHKEYELAAQAAREAQEKYATSLAMDGSELDRKEHELVLRGSNGQKTLDEVIATAGERVTESSEYKELVASGVLDMEKAHVGLNPIKALDREQLKTLLTGGGAPGSTLLRADRLPGIMPLLQAPLQLAQLITIGATDSNVIEWVRMSGVTNNAAEVNEATATAGTSGTKPESAMAFVLESTNVRTIAHWIPSTKQALSDIAQLRTLIDSMLIDGVRRRLNGQILNGDGTAPNLRGILATPGIGAIDRGTDPGVAADEPVVEAILRAITQARLGFFDPSAILMHPIDFMKVRLMRDPATGIYLFGPPSQVGADTIWGLRVVQDVNIAQGRAVVGDWSQAILYVREGVNVTATDSHSDFFVRNMVAILAEGRYALAVPRPQAFVDVTLT